MSVRELLGMIQSLRAELVGADIVEYNPPRDLNGVTAMVAAKLMKEIAVKIFAPVTLSKPGGIKIRRSMNHDATGDDKSIQS